MGRRRLAAVRAARPRACGNSARHHRGDAARLRVVSVLAQPRGGFRLGGVVLAGVWHAAQGLAHRAVARRARDVALDAGCRRASTGHADVAGWTEARCGTLELAAGDAGRGIRAVRRRPVALPPRDPGARPPGQRAAMGVRGNARAHLSGGDLRSAAAERAGPGDVGPRGSGCSSRGATGSIGIARRSSRNPPMQRVRSPRAAADGPPMHYDLATPVTDDTIRHLRINDTVTLQNRSSASAMRRRSRCSTAAARRASTSPVMR